MLQYVPSKLDSDSGLMSDRSRLYLTFVSSCHSFNNSNIVIIVLLTLEFPAMSSNTGLVNLSPSLRTITPTTTSTEN